MGDMADDLEAATEAREGLYEVRRMFGLRTRLGPKFALENEDGETERLVEEADYRRRAAKEDAFIKGLEEEIKTMKETYAKNRTAKVGETCICPTCKKSFLKTTYHKVFCSNQKTTKRGKNSCKDRYWNLTDEARRTRAIQMGGNDA